MKSRGVPLGPGTGLVSSAPNRLIYSRKMQQEATRKSYSGNLRELSRMLSYYTQNFLMRARLKAPLGQILLRPVSLRI